MKDYLLNLLQKRGLPVNVILLRLKNSGPKTQLLKMTQPLGNDHIFDTAVSILNSQAFYDLK